MFTRVVCSVKLNFFLLLVLGSSTRKLLNASTLTANLVFGVWCHQEAQVLVSLTVSPAGTQVLTLAFFFLQDITNGQKGELSCGFVKFQWHFQFIVEFWDVMITPCSFPSSKDWNKRPFECSFCSGKRKRKNTLLGPYNVLKENRTPAITDKSLRLNTSTEWLWMTWFLYVPLFYYSKDQKTSATRSYSSVQTRGCEKAL